ncbi:MAG: HGGxSTG domain-containing protein [Rhodomicrobium sp.]
MHRSPRCGARNRSGKPCQCPAMPNGRCYLHGGPNPGSPKGRAAYNFGHGRWTSEAVAERRKLSALLRESRKLMREIR